MASQQLQQTSSAAAHSQCLTQFDLMMQLASKRESAASVFDTAPKNMPKIAQNNFLFDQVQVGLGPGEDAAAKNLRSSITEESRSQARTPLIEKPTAGGGAPTFIKDRLRGMQRVWAAMTKFISSQCMNGRTVDLPLAGKFKKQKQPEGSEDDQAKQYAFMPHLDFVGSGHFKYQENDSNVSPLSKGAVGFQSGIATVSLTSVGAVCSLDRESVASVLKAIFVKFIEAGRSGKHCRLDMRVGYIIAYPNGSLQFENYPASAEDQDPGLIYGNDSRFLRRSPALTSGMRTLMDRQASEHKSSKLRRSQAAADPADKRSQSLYSSVRVSKGGFTRMSNNTSIMTPFTNIGGEASRYGGKNRTLKHWYEGKVFQPNSRQVGFALNKRELGMNQSEIYSQFSSANKEDFEGRRSQVSTSQAEKEMLESLKNNEFLPQVTFETFLAKKARQGKRTLFLNKPTSENARSIMKEHMQQSQARALARAENKVNSIEEERLEIQRVQDQIQELNEIEIEKKATMQEQHRENVRQGMAEKKMYQDIQHNFDKQFGFNDFPYTHGDDVEKAQASATKQWREELVGHLESKGAIKKSIPVSEDATARLLGAAPGEQELADKAKTLTEAQRNEHMLNLQTGSTVLRNQVRQDKVEFKNEKQEALYNKFIQETPFYAKKHKAVLARPQVNDAKNSESVIRDARKRFEMDLMRSKQREVEDEKELKALEEENSRFEMAIDVKRKQEKQAIREILHEQMEMDRMRKQMDRDDIKEPTWTHFGPEEDQRVSQITVNRRREMQNLLQEQLSNQINENQEAMKRKIAKQKLTDSVNMGAVNQKLHDERLEQKNNRLQQISDYKDAWSSQVGQGQNKRQVEKIVTGLQAQ